MGFLRGDGCFEAIRSYDGRPFAWEEHYHRLTASAGALGHTGSPLSDLLGWVEEVAAAGGDCIVRVVAHKGKHRPGTRVAVSMRGHVASGPSVPAGAVALACARALAPGRAALGAERSQDDLLRPQSGGQPGWPGNEAMTMLCCCRIPG